MKPIDLYTELRLNTLIERTHGQNTPIEHAPIYKYFNRIVTTIVRIIKVVLYKHSEQQNTHLAIGSPCSGVVAAI